ncbi:MAG: hypothetical protein U9R56_04225 [candidate division Zixibacteria bacterium]|nr:hypothetical protein [candidate division Zixibacteria bacterium]
MAYCPKCRYEYFTDILVCPDCNLELIDGLPTMGTAAVTPDDSWVVVGRVVDRGEIKAASRSLDSNNIPSMMIPKALIDHQWQNRTHSILNGVSEDKNFVMVPREYVHEALVLLSTVLDYDFPELETE